jgi:hypothetical protein
MPNKASHLKSHLAIPDEKGLNVTITLPRPHAKQREIIHHPARFKVVACGRRFGKTTLGIDVLTRAALSQPRPYAYFAPTYKMLAEVWRAFNAALAPVIFKRSEQEKRLELITGGAIDFWSLDHADAIRGRAYAGIVIDEAAMLKQGAGIWESVLSPLLADHSGWAYFLSTPRGRLNWFYDLFSKGQAGGEWASWQAPTTDNPHIPQSEIEAAKARMTPDIFAQEFEARFTLREGAVFPTWSESQNVTPLAEYEPAYPVLWACDVGYSNPTAILFGQYRPVDGIERLCIFDHVYARQLLPTQALSQALAKPYAFPAYFAYDPAAPTFAAEFAAIRDGRGEMTHILQGDNSLASTDALRALICDANGIRRLWIHPRCDALLNEIPDYHYRPVSQGDPRVDKVNDHAVDALRYMQRLIFYV